jgi:hypothetical protein
MFGHKGISSVSKADILAAPEPVWLTKQKTASRVRQRIRAVPDWATAREYRLTIIPNLRNQVSTSLPQATEVRQNTPQHCRETPYPSSRTTRSIQVTSDGNWNR